MVRVSRKKQKEENNEKKGLWYFLTGDVVHDEKLNKWAPLILVLVVLGIAIVANRRLINQKEKEINKLEEKYSHTLNELEEHNIFLSPEETLAIEQEAKVRGFIFIDTNIYKLDLRDGQKTN